MREFIPALLWSWAALSPFLFRLLPGRDAAITCLVLGWAFLPVAPYPSSALVDGGFDSSAHALAVPTSLLVNKGTAIGLGCLAGLLLFDRRTFERLAFDRVDAPMVAWCLVPLASSIANGLPLSEGLAQVRYLALAWGVPYLMGRAYLADSQSQARFAVGLAAGGLAYLPICLLEIVQGPTAYGMVYGPHPYEFEGMSRFLGHRPLGFLEHGNQLGIWMASSALAATWLWATGTVKKPGGVPGGILSAILIVATLLCQSHASILLLGLGLLPLLIVRVPRGRLSWPIAGGLVVALVVVALLLLASRQGFNPGAIRADVANFFRGIRKSSFTWRLARSEEYFPIALQRPWLGWGRADWRAGGEPFVNPVNLPIELLTLGMYGVLGLSAMLAVWLVPLVQTTRRWGTSLLGPGGGAAGTLVALLVMNALDGLSNATVILPIIAAVGGLSRPAKVS